MKDGESVKLCSKIRIIVSHINLRSLRFPNRHLTATE
jgi:hypothetical protein